MLNSDVAPGEHEDDDFDDRDWSMADWAPVASLAEENAIRLGMTAEEWQEARAAYPRGGIHADAQSPETWDGHAAETEGGGDRPAA